MQVFTFIADSAELLLGFDGVFTNTEGTLGDALTDTFGIGPNADSPEDFEVCYNFTPEEERELWGVSGSLDWQLLDHTNLVSISAFRSTDLDSSNDLDYSASDVAHVKFMDEYRQFPQEFRIRSFKGSKFEALTGVYLVWQDAKTKRKVVFGQDIGLLGDPTMIPGNAIPNEGDLITGS